MQLSSLLRASAALAAIGEAALDPDFYTPDIERPFLRPSHTRGSSRDTEHQRHRNRLARKARRAERLHRHTATGRKLLMKVSA